MTESTMTEETRVRLFRGIADGAQTHEKGIANASFVGEGLGLSKDQIDELRLALYAEHLIFVRDELGSGIVSVTPLGLRRLRRG